MSEDTTEDVKLEETEGALVLSDEGITFKETGEIKTLAELAATLGEMEVGMEVTSEYYEFPMGEDVRCMYVGDLRIMGKNGTKVPAVRILLPNEKVAINASAVIVSTFAAHEPGKCFIIQRTGTQKSANGEYHTYKISELVPKG